MFLFVWRCCGLAMLLVFWRLRFLGDGFVCSLALNHVVSPGTCIFWQLVQHCGFITPVDVDASLSSFLSPLCFSTLAAKVINRPSPRPPPPTNMPPIIPAKSAVAPKKKLGHALDFKVQNILSQRKPGIPCKTHILLLPKAVAFLLGVLFLRASFCSFAPLIVAGLEGFCSTTWSCWSSEMLWCSSRSLRSGFLTNPSQTARDFNEIFPSNLKTKMDRTNDSIRFLHFFHFHLSKTNAIGQDPMDRHG